MENASTGGAMRIMQPNFDELNEIEYCINGWEQGSGQMGCFVYDARMYEGGMGMWAISPLFSHVDELYAWAKAKGFKYHSIKACCVLKRDFE